MGLPASTASIVFQDSNGLRTTRTFEGRVAGLTDAQAIALADDLQAITQLEVVDLMITRRVTGFTPIAAETNSAVAETASVQVLMAAGGFHTFNLPALKAAVKAGKNVNGSNADLKTFLSYFDDGGGVAASVGTFFVSDGEELDEAYIEDNKVSGKVNR